MELGLSHYAGKIEDLARNPEARISLPDFPRGFFTFRRLVILSEVLELVLEQGEGGRGRGREPPLTGTCACQPPVHLYLHYFVYLPSCLGQASSCPAVAIGSVSRTHILPPTPAVLLLEMVLWGSPSTGATRAALQRAQGG